MLRLIPMALKEKTGGTDLAKNTSGLMATVEELLLLVEVVESGGYRAASERSGIPLASMSRRISALEERLGVCVIMRNTRRFEVTDMGRQLFEQGLKIRDAAHAAILVANDNAKEPAGDLRIACPMALSTILLCSVAVNYGLAHPRVRLFLSTTRGTTEALAQNFDIVIHPSSQTLPDSDVVAQQLVQAPYGLYAAPGLLQGREAINAPADLAGLDSIGWNSGESQTSWTLQDPQGRADELRMPARFVTDNLLAVKEAALAGLGVTRLPVAMAAPLVAEGRLRRLLPQWSLAPMTIYALYPSRRRLSLAGQAFLQLAKPTLQALVDGSVEVQH